MSEKRKKAILGLLFCVILIGVHAVWLKDLYSVVLYADDFHYWASGAFWAGYDWSSMVRHDFYYSYGYGLWLAPLFALTNDGVILFRMGIVLNYAFVVASFFLMVKITGKVMKESMLLKRCVMSLVPCVYPAWQIHANSAMCEALVYFIFVLIVYLLVEVERQPKMSKILGLGFLSVYIFMVHQRTLVVTIAIAAIMLVMRAVKRIDGIHFADYVVALVGSFAIHLTIKPIFQNYVYINYSTLANNRAAELPGILVSLWLKIIALLLICGGIVFLIHKTSILRQIQKNRYVVLLVLLCILIKQLLVRAGIEEVRAERAVNNDFGSILAKAARLFSGDNFYTLIKKICGHLFYFFVATGGMVTYGIVCIVVDVLKAIKEKNWGNYVLTRLFVMLVMIAAIGLSALAIGGGTSRVDALIYGRYSEYVVPMMLLIGMIYLQTEGIRWRERLTNVLLFVGISYPVYVYYKQCDILGLFSDFRFLSINAPALYTEFAVYNNGVLPAFGVGCLLTLVMLGIGLKKKAVPYITLIIVGVLFIYQGRAAIQAYLLPEQELQHSGNVIAELIEDKYEELDVYFMKEAYEAFHCSGYFQVRMPKEHILTLKDEQVLQLKEDCVVICDVYDVMSQQALEMVGFELIEKCETAVCYVRKMK